MTKANERFAKLVRSRRLELGLSQADVSRLGGPSTQTLRLWEHGKVSDRPWTEKLTALDTVLKWEPGTAHGVLTTTSGNGHHHGHPDDTTADEEASQYLTALKRLSDERLAQCAEAEALSAELITLTKTVREKMTALCEAVSSTERSDAELTRIIQQISTTAEAEVDGNVILLTMSANGDGR